MPLMLKKVIQELFKNILKCLSIDTSNGTGGKRPGQVAQSGGGLPSMLFVSMPIFEASYLQF